MRVFGLTTDDRKDWTSPYNKDTECIFIRGVAIGIKLRLMGGDLLSPDILGSGKLRPDTPIGAKRDFFNVLPGTVHRSVYEKPRKPFLSVRVGRFGFYIGHKVFGVDSEKYKDFPLVAPEDVHFGSQTLSGFTIRGSRSIGIKKP